MIGYWKGTVIVLKKLLSLLYKGIDNKDNILEKRRIFIINLGSLIAIFAILSYNLVYISLGYIDIVIRDIFVYIDIVYFAFVYYLNINRKNKASAILLSIACYATISIAIFYTFGNKTGLHEFYLLFAFLPFITLPINSYGTISLLVVLNIISYYYVDNYFVLENPSIVFPEDTNYLLREIAKIFSYFIILLLFFINNRIITHFANEAEEHSALAKKNEQLYKFLTENMQDVVWILDANTQQFKYISPSVYELRGYTVEEAMSLTAEQSVTPDEIERLNSLVTQRIKEFVESGYQAKFETYTFKQPRKDGSIVYVDITTNFYYNKENGHIEIHGVSRDVSKRVLAEKKLVESESRFRQLVELSPYSIEIYGKDGVQILMNRAAEEMWNVPASITMGKYNALESKQLEELDLLKYLKKAFAGETVEHTNYSVDGGQEVNGKTGRVRWLKSKFYPLFDSNKQVNAIVIAHDDITTEKEAENAIKEANEKLQQINATKDKFFSIIAHDLRGPLGNYKAITKMLVDEYDAFSETERKEFLDLLKTSSANIYELLENLLEWSRSQRGTLTFNPDNLNLFEVALQIEQLFSVSLQNKQVKFINYIPKNSTIYADPNLLNTILRNLVSNAIKFTQRGGEITLSCSENLERKSVILRVKDSGIGMSKDVIDKLFKVDVHHSTPGTENEAGTGLGLVLCKEFMTKHNGSIWVESYKRTGSEFFLEFPNKI